MESVLNQLTEWWNSNVAIANATGLTTMLVAFGYVFTNYKLNRKNKDIVIDVKQSSQETEKLAKEMNAQYEEIAKLETSIKLLTDLLFTFANSTKIDLNTKKDLASIYGQIASKENKKKVKEIVDKVVEKSEEVVEKVAEVAKPVEDFYEQVKNSISN